jgi:hypothetical protein
MVEFRIKEETNKRRVIEEYRKQQPLSEGTQKQGILVVLLKGSDEKSVKKAVDALKEEEPGLEFKTVPEPEDKLDISTSTSAVVFVANGSNEGAKRLWKQTSEITEGEHIATVLVSDHKNDAMYFDSSMNFEGAIMQNMLRSALNAAILVKRGESINGVPIA